MTEKKVAVVTGASRGIGRAVALELAGRGNLVVINYNGSAEKAEEVKKEIEAAGGEAALQQCDVSQYAECEAFIRQVIKDYGRLDILVNNAGITRDGLLMQMKEEDFDRVLEVNLKGAFYCMKLAAKGMMKRRYGRIVSISSISGVKGNAGQINYCAAKAGIIGMTKSLARELAPRGITVNAIAPGYIESDMTAVLPDKVKESVLSQVPLGRMGKPEEIAQAAAFLASDRAAYITGQTLLVDGGMGI